MLHHVDVGLVPLPAPSTEGAALLTEDLGMRGLLTRQTPTVVVVTKWHGGTGLVHEAVLTEFHSMFPIPILHSHSTEVVLHGLGKWEGLALGEAVLPGVRGWEVLQDIVTQLVPGIGGVTRTL